MFDSISVVSINSSSSFTFVRTCLLVCLSVSVWLEVGVAVGCAPIVFVVE